MTTVGTIQLLAIIDTSKYKQGASEIESTNKKLESSSNVTSNKMSGGFSKVAKVGMAAVIAATVAVGAAITANIGNAVKRVDTLVAFPKMLKALGAGSEEANSATKNLADSLQGLPTSLQDGARGTQAFVTTGLSVTKSTDAFLAFNNAMLAANVETGAAQATMQQLSQALSRGKIEGQEWNSITANMPTALQALQKQTGKSKVELQDLYRTNPQKLVDDLIMLNKEGGGGLASLEEQARTATGGIGTSFSNLGNAITRGIEGIVRSIGGGDLEAGQRKISDAITRIGVAFESGLKSFGTFVAFVSRNSDVFGPIAAALGTIIAGITIWVGIVKTATAVQLLWNIALSANPIGLIVIGIAAVIAALVVFFTKTELGRKLIQLFILGAVAGFRLIQTVVTTVATWVVERFNSIKNAIGNVVNWVKANWPLLLAIITGPIGIAILAVIRNFDKIKAVAGSVVSFIKSVFGGLSGWFSNLWSNITGIFKRVGTAIGNAIGGAFKSVINGIVGGAVGIINGFIRNINNVIGIVNKIPKVNVPTIGELGVPALANGGIISSPTLAMIGEGREAEAVIPLSKLDKMLNGEGGSGGATYNINIGTIAKEVDADAVIRKLTRYQELEAKGITT